MYLLHCQHQLLEILADNLKQPRPGLMQSGEIARLLKMTVKETRQILRSMHGLGIVESDMEGEYCLITPSGLQLVNMNHTRAYRS